MKKILYISAKNLIAKKTQEINFGWVNDREVQESFDIQMWGPGYSNLTLSSLKAKVDKFKPDYIYCYNRSKIHKWIPSLSSIKVPKIMVELDTYKYDPSDLWYSQFDGLYCRQQVWEMKQSSALTDSEFMGLFKRSSGAMGGRGSASRQLRKYRFRLKNARKWGNVKLFRWSVKKEDVMDFGFKREGIKFVGSINHKFYHTRQKMFKKFKNKIEFINMTKREKYQNILRKSSALVCPTESNFGDFVPAKIFEYAASGAAVITNCNLIDFKMKDLDKVVIHYSDLKDLENKLDLDFSKHYDMAREIMINHTHGKRYKEIFV